MIQAPNRPGHICLNDDELKSMATYKKSCDVCRLDLQSTKDTLQKCVNHGAPATAWWAEPNLVVGGFVISLGLGLAIGAAIAK